MNTGIKLVIRVMLNSIPCEGYNFHTYKQCKYEASGKDAGDND